MPIIRRLWHWLLHQVWYVHPAHMLLVGATPLACVQTLTQAAQPSAQRLHLRNLFAEGRRYYLRPDEAGFRMRSTIRVPWRRRQRTRAASVLQATCHEMADGMTRIDLRARMTLMFFLDVFVMPGWMSALLLFGPLPRQAGIGASLLILGLSWVWHRYTAIMQAMDMVYFIQVALGDLPEATLPELPAVANDTIYADFQQAWQKFYDEQSS